MPYRPMSSSTPVRAALSRPRFGRGLLLAALACAATLSGGAAQALNVVSVGAWQARFVGVDLAQATVNSSVAYAARIDLQAPGIHFTTSAHAGTLDAQVETTSSFLRRSQAQLAINAGFFTPCCSTQDVDIRGLAVSDGALVSPQTSASVDRSLAQVLTLSKNNVARIGTVSQIFGSTTVTSASQLVAADVWNAFSGSGIIVRNGANIASTHGSFGSPTVANPRTVVGVSQDARYLYLVAIDGRQAGYSSGVVMDEAADLMLSLGAWTALNADGGGSTTMAISDGVGGSALVNRPSNTGNAERMVSNSLAVYALAVPEPSAWLLWLPGLLLVAVRRRAAA